MGRFRPRGPGRALLWRRVRREEEWGRGPRRGFSSNEGASLYCARVPKPAALDRRTPDRCRVPFVLLPPEMERDTAPLSRPMVTLV
eukprot:scaffold20933_cov79-Isochrysis_galbana.AAC.1